MWRWDVRERVRPERLPPVSNGFLLDGDRLRVARYVRRVRRGEQHGRSRRHRVLSLCPGLSRAGAGGAVRCVCPGEVLEHARGALVPPVPARHRLRCGRRCDLRHSAVWCGVLRTRWFLSMPRVRRRHVGRRAGAGRLHQLFRRHLQWLRRTDRRGCMSAVSRGDHERGCVGIAVVCCLSERHLECRRIYHMHQLQRGSVGRARRVGVPVLRRRYIRGIAWGLPLRHLSRRCLLACPRRRGGMHPLPHWHRPQHDGWRVRYIMHSLCRRPLQRARLRVMCALRRRAACGP